MAHPQTDSPLFRLPPELRGLIAQHLFSSTTLYFSYYPFLSPIPNPLSLLRTCRRAYNELGDTWLCHALLDFSDPQTMLNELDTLGREVIARMRHVYVGSSHLRVFGAELLGCADALDLLPGLQLDTLTVRGGINDLHNMRYFEALLKEGRGFRELRFVFEGAFVVTEPQTSGPNTIFKIYNYYIRAQPQHWQGLLEERDGKGSRPRVNIYKSTVPECCEVAIDLWMRTRLNQVEEVYAGQFIRVFDDVIWQRGWGKLPKDYSEVVIVARRGRGIDYAV